MNQHLATKANQALDLNDAVRHIQSRQEFLAFARTFLSSLRSRPEDWTNRDLASFLEAMTAWIEDMDGYYQSRGEPVPEQPTWKALGQVLLAARIYE
jgi:hypothetical protein